MTDFKLSIELVPQSAWGENLRRLLTPAEWDTLRKETFQRDGYRCIYCGDTRRLHCHEKWIYREDIGTQYLARLVTLCALCHHIKHLGYAEVLCQQGKLDRVALIAHFCKVNACDERDFTEHRRDAYNEWARRSLMEWTLDLIILEGRVNVKT